VRREVRRAFEQAPESHRAKAFDKEFQNARQILCALTKSAKVEFFLGSGTLANDVIAAQLSLQNGRGLVLSNGEFGERLVDHSRRFGLNFDTFESAWGQAIDLPKVRQLLESRPSPAWLWCTHCETSTGVLNDLERLKDLCSEFQVKLCLDCISSAGTLPLDLTGVYLASCSSGKGLRSYPGISMVFYHHAVAPQPGHLPRYLDLGYYASQNGVPFTFSSNLLHALHAAVKHVPWESRYAELDELSTWLRSRLKASGFELVGSGTETSPAVIAIALPDSLNSVKIGDLMQESGYLISYNSEYLVKRNWIQICLMGDCAKEKLTSMSNALIRLCLRRPLSQLPTTTAVTAPIVE